MAQWRGQYSGNTHGAKVKGVTSTLVRAIDAYRACEDREARTKKGKAVVRLVAKLWRARRDHDASETLRALGPDDALAVLDKPACAWPEGGSEILVEFGVPELVEAEARESS